jgi:hypothetical protein
MSTSSNESRAPTPPVITRGSNERRPTFVLPRRSSDDESSTQGATTPAAQAAGPNPFSPPGTPALTASSRVHSSSSIPAFFPSPDIVRRSSGILSQHAAGLTDPFSSGRSNISSGSAGEITEEARPGMSPRTGSSLVREAFASPPLRPLTMYMQSRNGSQVTGMVVPPKVKRAKSTMLTGEVEKPWLKEKDTVGK